MERTTNTDEKNRLNFSGIQAICTHAIGTHAIGTHVGINWAMYEDFYRGPIYIIA